MAGFADEDMLKHLTIMTHKEELIKMLKSRMEIADRQLYTIGQTATRTGNATFHILPNAPLSTLSPIERKKVEAARDRDEEFAKYAAKSRMKMKEKESLKKVLDDNKKTSKLEQEFMELKKREEKKLKTAERLEYLKDIEHDRKLKEAEKEQMVNYQKEEYQLKLKERYAMQLAKKIKIKNIEKQEREDYIAQIREDQRRKSKNTEKNKREQQKLEQQYRELLVLVEEKERQIVKSRIKNRSRRKPDRAVRLPIEIMSNKNNKVNSTKMNQRTKWQT